MTRMPFVIVGKTFYQTKTYSDFWDDAKSNDKVVPKEAPEYDY